MMGRRFKIDGSDTTNPVNGSTLSGKFVGPYCTGTGVAVGAGVEVAVAVGTVVAVGIAVIVAFTADSIVALACSGDKDVWQADNTVVKTSKIAMVSVSLLK
jgi:hypothetical protein